MAMEFLEKVNQSINAKSSEIEEWIEEHCQKIIVPLYTSVDLRVSGHKITPVTTSARYLESAPPDSFTNTSFANIPG